NSPPATLEAQMANANLQQYFERNFSVDSVRRFKPAPEPYRMVASELEVDTSALRLIAAHAWDVGGAMQAGCAGAFVARKDKALFPLMKRPDIIGRHLREVSQAIIQS
ncbi:MAG: haloacid dehalogenase type II, partial [Acidobacteriota bacterium]|nr:haloacid dehalogenase type II [Acidobacteriota bacterium]